MTIILSSWDIYYDAYDITLNNCLPERMDLINYYWVNNFRFYIRNNLYKENNQISEESIVEALTK